jgi:hypothetical protein
MNPDSIVFLLQTLEPFFLARLVSQAHINWTWLLLSAHYFIKYLALLLVVLLLLLLLLNCE